MARRNELDWLRVILVFAVFLHHCLMPFNGDDWHITNNQASKILDDVMVFFEQLRLPCLFLIAGAGSVLLLSKVTPMEFLQDKLSRLLLPLLVGVVFVVPPQTYYEYITQYDSFLSAYPSLVLDFKTNHLWFVEYLVLFSALSVAMYRAMESRFGQRFLSILERFSDGKYGLSSFVILLIGLRVSLNHWFSDEAQHTSQFALIVYYGFFFLMGMLLIRARHTWQNIATHRLLHLKLFIASSVVFYLYYFPDYSPYLGKNTRWMIWWAICSLVTWFGTLAMLGYAQRLFTHSPTWLTTSNKLIYPFYIFHQTIIVVIAYYIVQTDLSIGLKASSLTISSLLITIAICYFVIKPFNVMRMLFGLKPKQPKTLQKAQAKRS